MTVLPVEGLKVRCTDERNQQYWFDMIVLERYKGEAEEGEAPNDGCRQTQHLAGGHAMMMPRTFQSSRWVNDVEGIDFTREREDAR